MRVLPHGAGGTSRAYRANNKHAGALEKVWEADESKPGHAGGYAEMLRAATLLSETLSIGTRV